MPLYIEFLDNQSGNSSTQDRILILQKVIDLLGKSRIGAVIADREFVGKE
jgi:predicted DNA-binding transcriptional regulator AlpA